MSDPSLDPNILYAFLGFIGLVLVAMLAILFRNSRDIGELRGEVRGINARFDETNRRIEELNANLSARIEEVNSNLSARIEELNANLSARIESLERSLTSRIESVERRIENLEQSVTALREHVARETGEIRGMLQALHERVDLVMRHRHDNATGEVILTPEQVVAD
jgi:chromosome segregation ATPase